MTLRGVSLPANSKRAGLIVALLPLFFLMLYMVSPSLRGSDQYWYVGDVERVVLHDGMFKTNSVFPASLPDDLQDLPRPWVQNKPVSYLVLLVTYITRNGHVAWLLLNTVCLFITAFIVASLLRIDKKHHFTFLLFFLFFPFNFYLATQALPEIFLMAVIAVIQYLLLSKPLNVPRSIIIGLLSGLLICHRANFFLLLPLLPVSFYLLDRKNFFRHSSLFIGFALLIAFCSTLFNSHLIDPPSILNVIIYNMPGVTNMGSYFPDYAPQAPGFAELFSIFIEKLIGAFKIQFSLTDGGSTIMFYIINLLLLCIPVLLAKRRLITSQHSVCLVFIAVHFATIVLFFNQYRYAAAIIPSLFILNADWLREYLKNWKNVAEIAIAACLFISIAIGLKIRKEAETDQKLLSEIRAHISDQTPIMCVYNPNYSLAVGYAVSPALVYYFLPKTPLREWATVAKKLKAEKGIINVKSRLYRDLKPYVVKEKKLKFASASYIEFRMP